jgi:hypothetical protein
LNDKKSSLSEVLGLAVLAYNSSIQNTGAVASLWLLQPRNFDFRS